MEEPFQYQIFGLNIASEFPLLGIPDSRFSKYDIQIYTGQVPATLEGYVDRGVLYFAAPGRFLFTLDAAGRFLVLNGEKIIVAKEENADEKVVNLFLQGSVMGALLMQRGLTAMHGCTIAKEEVATILAGKSGTGKSSLGAEFVKRGYSLIADDISVIDYRNSIAVVKRGIQNIKLWKDALLSLELDAEEAERVRPGMEKYSFPFDNQFVQEETYLKTIVFLEEKNTSGFTIEEISGIEKFDYVRSNVYRKIYIEPLGVHEQIFRTITCLLDTTRVFRIVRPNIPLQIKELADFIESESILN